MKVPWQKDGTAWVEVAPGEEGTPWDEFTAFTYWEPSASLSSSLEEDARQSGRQGLPDVTAPEPLDEPDGLSRLRAIVLDACHGRSAAAVALFAQDRAAIADIASRIKGRAPTASSSPENLIRDQAEFNQLRPRLDVLEEKVNQLEDALERRIGRLVAHFDRLASEFTHELKQSHPYAAILSTRWDPTPLVVPEEVRVFGQDTARQLIAEADAVIEALETSLPADGDEL